MSESHPVETLEASPQVVEGEEWLVVSYPLPSAPAEAGLTAAEREVVALQLEGLSQAQIAARRGTSQRTVANQLAAIYRKLGVSSRTELAARLASEALAA